jgi:hypothetical protein
MAVVACAARHQLMPAHMRRSMKRRRWMLPLEIVAECDMDAAGG